MALKRKRDPTFAACEKHTLIDLVEKYFHVIENKKTDSVTIRAKHAQWQTIATEFNSTSNLHTRDWASLKTCWENLKKRAKTLNILRNKPHSGTGPPIKVNEDSAIERVIGVLQTRLAGLNKQLDPGGAHGPAAGTAAGEAGSRVAGASSSVAAAGSRAGEAEGDATNTSDNEIVESQVRTECAETYSTYDDDRPPSVRRARPRPCSPREVQQPEIHQPETDPLSTPLWSPDSATTSPRASLNEEQKPLLTFNVYSEDEHTLNISILQEKLKQERLRTEQEQIKKEQELFKKEQEQIKKEQELIKKEQEQIKKEQELIKKEQEQIKLEMLRIELRKLKK